MTESIMMTDIMMTDIMMTDIMTFVNDNSRADNDSTNRIREKIIANIYNIPSHYFEDAIHGPHWTTISNKLKETLQSLCSHTYDRILIEQKGGMSYNHDFVVYYYNENNVVHSIKLEFKNNNSNVKDLIQFLELYDKDCKTKFGLFEYSYSEYYYDHYLDNYLAIDGDTTITKPSKEEYLSKIHDINYSHPFFNYLYSNRDKNKSSKTKIVTESRKTFLQNYSNLFNFEKIEEKIKLSQTDKVFLFWDKTNFHIQMINSESIKIIGIKPGSVKSLYFDLAVNNYEHDIRVRLNWGNNNGIANPRWKFTFINK
jgi:hypothetical protein